MALKNDSGMSGQKVRGSRMATISNTITSGIELASTNSPGTYASPLTITAAGYVNAGTNGVGNAAVCTAAANPLYLQRQIRGRLPALLTMKLSSAGRGCGGVNVEDDQRQQRRDYA
jgi:hypothetical protein